MRRRLTLAAATAAVAVIGLGGVRDAAACGGLVAPNGAVRLERATTLAAWHDGVEHYLTSFAYQGDVSDVGWIVPLPAVPDSVVKGGAWTLQRLEREARPVPAFRAADGAGLTAAPSAEVILKTTVDSLDITVIKGSGQAVVDWCATNKFALNDETRAHILGYAQASPIFMAARYDTHAARLKGFFQGDGTPVLITMHTPHLWVPFEVLANSTDQLNADLFLLTDERPDSLGSASIGDAVPEAPGMSLLKQERVDPGLRQDLASQPNMSWVPESAWLTALTLETTGNTVTYDLTASQSGLTLAPMGVGPTAVDVRRPAQPIAAAIVAHLAAARSDATGTWLAIGLSAAGGLAALIGTSLLVAGRRRTRAAARR